MKSCASVFLTVIFSIGFAATPVRFEMTDGYMSWPLAGGSDFVIQTSTNLKTWDSKWNYYLRGQHPDAKRYILPDLSVPARYFRALSPGQSFTELRARWQNASIRNYEYTFEHSKFFAEPVSSARGKVTVRNGEISAIEAANVPPAYYSRFKTVDQIFEIMAQAFNEAELLEVEYDEAYGFPAFLTVDEVVRSADDENIYRISDFRALP